MMTIVALYNLSIRVQTNDARTDTIIWYPHSHSSHSLPTMNQSFQHFTQAVNFIMSEFELTQDEAFNFVVKYMSNEGNTLSIDIAPLAYGTYQQ